MGRLDSESLSVIKVCFQEKGWRGSQIVREFPNRGWNCRCVDQAIKRLQTSGSIQYE